LRQSLNENRCINEEDPGEEVISLANKKIEKMMNEMKPAEKREVLNSLVTTLLKDLNEAEKEEMLRTVAAGRREGKHLAALVDD
jgi:hypothetical protein